MSALATRESADLTGRSGVFRGGIAGNAALMSDERADRRATDEEIAPDAAPAGDDPVVEQPGDGVERGAGYDVDAVSGDTDLYRPA